MSRKSKSCAGVYVEDHYPVGAFDTSKAKKVKPLKHKDLLLAEVEKFVRKGKAAQKAVEKITKHFGGPTTSIRLTAPERDTILAALRHWQNRICPLSQRNNDRDIELISTNGGEHPALTSPQINALCADLNR